MTDTSRLQFPSHNNLAHKVALWLDKRQGKNTCIGCCQSGKPCRNPLSKEKLMSASTSLNRLCSTAPSNPLASSVFKGAVQNLLCWRHGDQAQNFLSEWETQRQKTAGSLNIGKATLHSSKRHGSSLAPAKHANEMLRSGTATSAKLNIAVTTKSRPPAEAKPRGPTINSDNDSLLARRARPSGPPMRMTRSGATGPETRHQHQVARSPIISSAISVDVTLSCAICANDVPRASIPSTITGKCSHPNQTCRACIASWIASRLDSSGHDSLTCPECNELLSEIDIKAFAAPEVYGRYEDQVLRSALSKDPEFHWCVAPGCHAGHLHAGSGPIFRCVQCGNRSCIKHNVLWHEGMTCAEYDSSARSSQREKEEAASIEKVKETSRPCPGRGCGWRIEKKGGCDHMTCHKCKTEFCWRCFADYKDIRKYGNMAHQSSCHYHPTNL
ncbi:ring finger protein [Apiospora arundinis]|uniref:RBR-type E3 ubiquitin transferase n=1 Tax=Apiospora arundinis TaxID=335852 RepID=A0ABR2IXJ5_9PEZI